MMLRTTTPPAVGTSSMQLEGEPRRLRADLFHAMSQPLTALCCSLELTLQQAPSAEQYRETVRRALMQAERVSRLVTGIRELFEAEQAGESCQVLPLRVAVASAIDDVLLLAQAAGVQICYLPSSACPVWFEEQRLRRGLFHLLDFLVGCGNRESVVRIELGECEEQSRLALTVSGSSVGHDRVSSLNSDRDDQTQELARRLGLGIAGAIFEAAGGTFRAERSLEDVSVEVRLPRVGALVISDPDGHPAVGDSSL